MHFPEGRTAATDFRRLYGDLEAQRSTLAARLKSLGQQAHAHAGYGRALRLINDVFRKSALAQRREILGAADWLIGVLEQVMQAGQAPRNLGGRGVRRVLPPSVKSLSKPPRRNFTHAP
jgi:hypothetical protein